MKVALRRAARILADGGVVAYPTEGVFGLGCRPDDPDAVMRILDIKQRDVDQGLLLIAADIRQLDGWIALPADCPDLRSQVDRPVTWIVPATEAVPPWIRGRHAGVAIRLTAHPVARALCAESGLPLVSTSANVAGRAPTRRRLVLLKQFGGLVDCIAPGDCGPAAGPSEIRDLATGEVLRPA